MPPQYQLDNSTSDDITPIINGEDRRRNYITHLSMDDGSARDIKANLLGDDNVTRSQSAFIRHFIKTNGPPQIIALCLIIALALGSTIGVVPAVVEDRYARLHHGYNGNTPCLEYAKVDRPHECELGNSDAQNSAALASFVSNTLTFCTSSLMGSISDEKGRKGIMLIGIGMSLCAPFFLVMMQLFENMSPFPYYASHAISGLVSWMTISLSSLSDVMPPQWRAPSFGLVLAGFSLGFAFSPILAVFLSHLGVSIFAFSILVAGFIMACLSLPETLSKEAGQKARLKRLSERPTMMTQSDAIKYNMLRPMRELMILNRNRLFRLLSALAFFSGCISTADHTLLLYYLQDVVEFNDKDIAALFMIIGIMGMLVQAVLLKPLNSMIGERRVIIVAFLFGAAHNYMYGIAKAKSTIFIAATIASLTGMSFPTISAIKSNNVEEIEQGRIQGALYSLSSLASALGPMMLRYVYSQTKDGGGYGKGTMFIFGAGLYLIATFCAYLLPEEQANSNLRRDEKKRNSLVKFDTSVDYGATQDTDSSEEDA